MTGALEEGMQQACSSSATATQQACNRHATGMQQAHKGAQIMCMQQAHTPHGVSSARSDSRVNGRGAQGAHPSRHSPLPGVHRPCADGRVNGRGAQGAHPSRHSPLPGVHRACADGRVNGRGAQGAHKPAAHRGALGAARQGHRCVHAPRTGHRHGAIGRARCR
eukprot:365737-Chlamydomonas_euryale.AAC.2